jgi:hypothetical protein
MNVSHDYGQKYVDSLAAFLFSNGNHTTGNNWTSKRCSEEVNILGVNERN